jgi:hypothetical protein
VEVLAVRKAMRVEVLAGDLVGHDDEGHDDAVAGLVGRTSHLVPRYMGHEGDLASHAGQTTPLGRSMGQARPGTAVEGSDDQVRAYHNHPDRHLVRGVRIDCASFSSRVASII